MKPRPLHALTLPPSSPLERVPTEIKILILQSFADFKYIDNLLEASPFYAEVYHDSTVTDIIEISIFRNFYTEMQVAHFSSTSETATKSGPESELVSKLDPEPEPKSGVGLPSTICHRRGLNLALRLLDHGISRVFGTH